MSTIGQTNALLGNVAKLGFVVVTGVAVWLGWRVHDGDERRTQELVQRSAEITRLVGAVEQAERQNVALNAQVATQQQQIAEQRVELERLGLALRLQKVERRVARIVVLDQRADAGGVMRTRVRFEEVDAAGNPVGKATEATIAGSILYVDAWVVKFDDFLVEGGDELRGASLVLFRRLFGEHQAPSDGVALDGMGERPAAYGGDSPMGELERSVWNEFWEYANDAKRAAAAGIRAAHGEAPSIQLRTGEVYTVTLRASSGLTVSPDRAAVGGH